MPPEEGLLCVKHCTSTEHGNRITSALTKRGVSDAELCAYLNDVCEFCGGSKDATGRTALHMAASCGRVDVCRWLVCRKQARLDERDRESGYTALHRSVFYGKLNVAVTLIKLGSNTNLLDSSDFSPVEHALYDNLLEPTHGSNAAYRLVYMWGANSNYTLGPTPRNSPEVFDTFHKAQPTAIVRQVCLGKFHTVIVTDSAVYSYGNGQGGKLGLGSEKTTLEPTEIKFPANCAPIKTASIARDHSLFLSQTGQVLVCGLNNHCVLGCGAPQLLAPRLLHCFGKEEIVGVGCSRYHSVAWSKDNVYTWGLHGGQLGHGVLPEKCVAQPKLVSFRSSSNDVSIVAVATSYGATAVALMSGDIYIFHEFQNRRITSKEYGLRSIGIIGGKLTSELIEPKNSELKVVVLTKGRNIMIWQESDPHLSRVIFTLNRLLDVRQVLIHNNGLYFITMARELFNGKLKPRKKNAGEEKCKETKGRPIFNKFLDRNDCIVAQISKVHKIYGADSIVCDVEGENFAALHINVLNCMTKTVSTSPSTMSRDIETFLHNDAVEPDVEFKVEDRTFPAHKYIVANVSDKLHRMVQTSDLVEIKAMRAPVFEQILKYAYTNTCDLLRPGPCSAELRELSITKSKVEALSVDGSRSAFEVYRKTEQAAKPKSTDPVRLVQEAARMLEMKKLYKDLSNFTYSDGCVSGKKVVISKMPTFDPELFPEYHDVRLVAKNGKGFDAHRCVLCARCEFFANMFSMRWLESKKTTEITLPFPQLALKHLLTYLYTDSIDFEHDDLESLSGLLLLADYILLPRLIEICELELSKLISIKTVFRLLQLSHYYGATQLKQFCMEFVCLNLAVILEARYLEQMDDDILRELTVFYGEWNERMHSRVITPFSDAVADEIVVRISMERPIDMNFDDGLIVKRTTPKSAHRKRNRHKITTVADKSEDRKENVPIRPQTPEQSDERGEVTVGFSRARAIISARARLVELGDDAEYVNLKDLSGSYESDFPDLGSSYGSPPDSFGKLTRSERAERIGKIAKLSQKQRKRLSFENEVKQVPESPKNPWKVIEPLSPVGSPSADNVNISKIITEEKKQKENLSKIRSKLLIHTQMEDKALEDLHRFYNADNVCDEIIVVERVRLGTIATPVWVQK